MVIPEKSEFNSSVRPLVQPKPKDALNSVEAPGRENMEHSWLGTFPTIILIYMTTGGRRSQDIPDEVVKRTGLEAAWVDNRGKSMSIVSPGEAITAKTPGGAAYHMHGWLYVGSCRVVKGFAAIAGQLEQRREVSFSLAYRRGT